MADENRSAGTGAENPENKRVLVHADVSCLLTPEEIALIFDSAFRLQI